MDKNDDLLSLLLKTVELKEFVTFELFAKRNEGFEGTFSNETVEIKPTYTLKTGVLKDASGIIIRLSVEFELPIGKVLCDIGVTFSSNSPVEIAPSDLILIEFANEIAVMMLIPFVRQSIVDLSQKTFGIPLLMPLIRKGSLQFTSDNS